MKFTVELLVFLATAVSFGGSQSCVSNSGCPDTQSQQCTGGSCVCKPGFQSDQATTGTTGCCPNTLNVTKGLCYVSASMPKDPPNCLSFCTSQGVGVNLVTFPSQTAYQTLVTMLFNNGAPNGAPFLLGIGKTTAAGPPNWDTTQDWTSFQYKQPPTYTQFANPSAPGAITYFTLNGATAQDWIIVSSSFQPTVTYSVGGNSFPLPGYIALCVYYPPLVPTTAAPAVTGAGSLTTCAGGCGVNSHGYISSSTNALICCSSLSDVSTCASGYSCVAAVTTGYACCQAGYTTCQLPTSFNHGSYYWNKMYSTNNSAAAIGDTITFYCNSGFLLTGVQGIQCSGSNTWTAPFPSCTATQCDYNAIISLNLTGCPIQSGPYYPGDRVKFICNAGSYLKSRNTRSVEYKCDVNGHWSPTPEQCGTSCPLIDPIANGQVYYVGTFNVLGTPMPGSGATFSCQPGFDLVGFANLTCLSDGTYTRAVPSCQPDDVSEAFWWWPYIVGFFFAGWGFLCGFGCYCSHKKITSKK